MPTIRGNKLTRPDTSSLGIGIDHLDIINENGELPGSPKGSFKRPSFGNNDSCGENWIIKNAQNDSTSKTKRLREAY